MTIDPSVFKAYDVRGVYPGEIDEEGAERVGAAFIAVTGAKRVAVGHDVRLSSPSMAEAFTAGAIAAGADVVELGLCATEMLYFAVADGGFDAGACITASHNPPQYTGAKMVTAGAVPLSGDAGIGEVGRIAMAGPPHAATPGTRSAEEGLLGRFVDKCMSFVDPDAIRGLRVVLDAANGMSGVYLPPVLERLDIDAVPFFLDPDGRFPNHEPNPLLPENRAFIMAKVREEKADLGIAFDGDADRCFFIDDTGEFVAGDFLTALLARHLLARTGPAAVVYDLRASWAVRDTVEAAGGTADMHRVGHAFIKRRMREIDAVFAGEVSGHYYFKDFSFADTGLIPALLVMEMVATTGRPLSELIAEFRARYHISGEINSTVSDAPAAIERIRERYADGRQTEIDGLSVEYDDWHFNVRSSNTEPLLRLNLESLVSEADMERRRDEVLEVILSGVTDSTAVVEAEDVEVRYHGGPEPAVRGVSLVVAAGEGLLVSGSAGSGKTSLLRGLLGLVEHRGRAALLGAPVGAAATRGRVGYGPQGDRFAAGLRVREVVAALAALRRDRGAPAARMADDALARAGMSYVGGWRTSRLDAEGFRRLSLAMAIVGDPPLVVLDDPWVLSETLREIASARARGAAVLAAAARPAGLAPALGRRIVLADGVVR